MRHVKAKHRELLKDVMNEVEKKHLQTQMYNIATIAAEKTQKGESRRLATDELLKAISDLLKILIDDDTLQVYLIAISVYNYCYRYRMKFNSCRVSQLFGWPDASIQDILEAVIRRCGHQPLTSDSDLLFTERLRENVKLLFSVVVEDSTVKSLLTTKTVDDVILHVLEISKEYASDT